jgi:tetratricopeptide (TPR) repeat protein
MTETLQTIDALLYRRDLKKAEVAIAKALRKPTPDALTAALLRRRAQIRLMRARIDEALSDMTRVRTLDPALFQTAQSVELWGDLHLARFELAALGFADRQDTHTALAAYTHLLESTPEYANAGWVMYQRGRVLLTQHAVAEAQAAFTQALLMPSTQPALTAYAYERLAFIAFYEHRSPQTASGFIERAIATYPADEHRIWLAQAFTLSSRILREVPDLPGALAAARAAVQIAGALGGDARPVLADALFNAGETASLVVGHEREVLSLLEQFLVTARRPVGIDVTWSRAFEMIGDAAVKRARFQSAVTAYTRALQHNPYNPWELSILLRLARAHYQLHEYEHAIHLLERLLQRAAAEHEPVDYRVYRLLANARYATGRYRDAVEAFEHALALAAPHTPAWEEMHLYCTRARHMLPAVTQAGSNGWSE